MSEQEKKTTLGDPMFVESLMTRDEWMRRYKRYPSSTKRWTEVFNVPKPNSFKWRFGMGGGLSSTEIGNINGNLDYLLKKVKGCTT